MNTRTKAAILAPIFAATSFLGGAAAYAQGVAKKSLDSQSVKTEQTSQNYSPNPFIQENDKLMLSNSIIPISKDRDESADVDFGFNMGNPKWNNQNVHYKVMNAKEGVMNVVNYLASPAGKEKYPNKEVRDSMIQDKVRLLAELYHKGLDVISDEKSLAELQNALNNNEGGRGVVTKKEWETIPSGIYFVKEEGVPNTWSIPGVFDAYSMPAKQSALEQKAQSPEIAKPAETSKISPKSPEYRAPDYSNHLNRAENLYKGAAPEKAAAEKTEAANNQSKLEKETTVYNFGIMKKEPSMLVAAEREPTNRTLVDLTVGASATPNLGYVEGNLGVQIRPFDRRFAFGLMANVGFGSDKIINSYSDSLPFGIKTSGSETRTNRASFGLSAEIQEGPVIVGGGFNYTTSVDKTVSKIYQNGEKISSNTNSTPERGIVGKIYSGIDFSFSDNFGVRTTIEYSGDKGLTANIGARIGLNYGK